MIKSGQQILDTDFIFSLTAGENLSANDACYISTSDGKVYKCDADDTTKMDFVGFAQEAATTNNTVRLIHDGQMTGLSSLTIGAVYYLSGTAGAITATAPTNVKVVGKAISATILKIAEFPTVRVQKFERNSNIGDSTTRFDITNPSGTTFRYTYDGTGTDPSINATTFPTGSRIQFAAQNFNASNNGTFTVTASGSNYVEVTNASGVAENDKTIGSGYVVKQHVWTKLAGLKYIEIEVVGAGGDGAAGVDSGTSDTGGGGGGGGGYARKLIRADALGSTENILVASTGASSSFGSHASASSGSNGSSITGGAGGTGSSGDINIAGGAGQSWTGNTANNATGSSGGSSALGGGGLGSTGAGANGGSYGGGGAGGGSSGGSNAGGTGASGVVIVKEYF